MESSPAEALNRLAAIWDRALDALGRSELVRVEDLLGEADAVFAALHDRQLESDDERQAWRRASESHNRLVAVLGSCRQELAVQLRKVRQGRRVLKTYGNRSAAVGTRLRSEG